MQIIEEAIKKVFTDRVAVLIPCTDQLNQESLRTMVFHVKRKLPEVVSQCIGVSKFSYEGKLYVKVYPKEIAELFTIGPDGVPERVNMAEEIDNAENNRIVELMRKDGKTEEEIAEFLKGE